MNSELTSLFVILGLGLTSCATFKAQNCTENAGYEKGMNDAKMGRMMSMGQFTTFCSGEEVEAAQRGYRAGYEAAKKSEGGPTMNISLDGGKIGLVGAYNCQLNYRNQSFSDRAATEVQARNNVVSKCRQKFASCPETSVSCAKN